MTPQVADWLLWLLASIATSLAFTTWLLWGIADSLHKIANNIPRRTP